MNKDIIYIDVEDDITAIIGRIKASREKIVALVPPKRIGVLQSAVNLRLLARMADTNNKHLVLVTNNKALIALSAMAKIPVAKNLQSKPEIAEIAALDIDDGEDIIDGSQLPVGELAKTSDIKSEEPADDVSDVIEDINIEDESLNKESAYRAPVAKSPSDIPKQPITKEKGKVKIPNFSRFRKRLFFGIPLAGLLIYFLVWANVTAPAAKVIITAKTSKEPISLALKLGGSVATDVSKNTVQTITKQIKKDISVDFTATGKEDLGVKSSGSITIRNCDYSEGFTLKAGTRFTNSDNVVFVSKAAVTVPKYTGLPSACVLSGSMSGKATVAVEASASGESYNVLAAEYGIDSISSAANVDAQGTAMVGGTTRMSTVVTAEDIQKASQALVDLSTSDIKQQLTKQFTNGEIVIADSFSVERAAAVSVPALKVEAADGKAKLTSQGTFTITAIAKTELQSFLKDALTKQMSNSKSQRIYKDGIESVSLSGYIKQDDGTSTVNIATTGQIGPNIDQAFIKEQVKGMKFGDIQALLQGINGISNVDVKFSYFWVSTVPDDIKKIDVEFKLQDE